MIFTHFEEGYNWAPTVLYRYHKNIHEGIVTSIRSTGGISGEL